MGVWECGNINTTFNIRWSSVIGQRPTVIDQLVFSDKNHTDNK
jgi:hypothetical protein